jgi:hypothetical protein
LNERSAYPKIIEPMFLILKSFGCEVPISISIPTVGLYIMVKNKSKRQMIQQQPLEKSLLKRKKMLGFGYSMIAPK